MKLVLGAAILTSLALATGAQAHFGNIWFDTAKNTERAIEAKYPRVLAASCRPIPQHLRGRYPAHSQSDGWVRRWDHFLCGVASTTGRACAVIAHHTGPEQRHVVLTTFHVSGCTRRDLR